MTGHRPITFILFAILNFVAAIAFIGCGVCANVSDGQTWHIEINNQRWDEKKLNAHLQEKVPAYKAVKITGIVLGYGACVGLILSGVAMLFGGLPAKLFALFVYAAGFLHHLVMIVYQLVWVNPAINQFFDQIPPAIIVGQAAAEVTRQTSKFPSYVSITWWVVGCLFYLLGAAVVAFSSTAAPAAKEQEDEEEKPRRKSRRNREDEDTEDDEDDDEDDRRKSRRKR